MTSSKRWVGKLKKAVTLFSSGNAGLASNFMDLGHCKLKDGGVLALVVPFAFLRGKSWQSARQALKAHYSDIHVTSIAATGSTARAFSADTGMAECLVVATRRSGGNSCAAYSNLAARPSSLLEAAVRAKNARGQTVQGDILDAGCSGCTIHKRHPRQPQIKHLLRHPGACPQHRWFRPLVLDRRCLHLAPFRTWSMPTTR